MIFDGPTHVLRAKINALATPLTVRRRDTQSSGQYGQSASGDYQTLGERDIYVYTTSVRSEQTGVGEESRERLEGYCLMETDIEEDDRIVYDGRVYEIERPVGVPEHDPSLLRIDGEYVGDV